MTADANLRSLIRASDALATLENQIRHLTSLASTADIALSAESAVIAIDAYETELARTNSRSYALERALADATIRAEIAEAERDEARTTVALVAQQARKERRQATAAQVALDYGTIAKHNARAEMVQVLRDLYRASRNARLPLEAFNEMTPPDRFFRLLDLDPMVDDQWYKANFFDQMHPEESALDHFKRAGATAGFKPNNFFDFDWYAKTYNLHNLTPFELLLDFMDTGVCLGRDPGPNFSVDGYLLHHYDVAQAGRNPLSHYLHWGASEGRKKISASACLLEIATPFRDALYEAGFDENWYCQRYPDVPVSGTDPLFHYLEFGMSEGRDPGPNFSTTAYLTDHPIIAAKGVNPLVDYAFTGRFEGRHARPVEVADIAEQEVAAAASVAAPISLEPRFSVRKIRPTQPGEAANPHGPLLVCVTHVPPYPMRAGNEYRIGRFLNWLQAKGFRTAILIGPLDSQISDDQIDEIGKRYGDVAVVERGGEIRVQSRSGRLRFDALSGRKIRAMGPILDEPEISHEGTILHHERTFCFDALIEAALCLQNLDEKITFYINYIFMTRWLPLMDRKNRSFIDMHDLFSAKLDQVRYFGVADGLTLTAETESRLMRRADAIFAIQSREAQLVRRLAPNLTVATMGVDFDFVDSASSPKGTRVLVVGSGNALNRKGMADFLRFAWNRIRAAVPQAELRIVGSMGAEVSNGIPGVTPLGIVDDLTSEYRAARLVINPVVAGTGLKVKSVEALSHFRPLVAWPNGVDGIATDLLTNCSVVRSWPEFADAVISKLVTPPRLPTSSTRTQLSKRFGGDTVYAEAGRWLGVERSLFGRYMVAQQPSGWWSKHKRTKLV